MHIVRHARQGRMASTGPVAIVSLRGLDARAAGATIISATVRVLRASAAGVEAELGDGGQLHAETAIVATGAFTASYDLLPVPVALRAKSEVYAMAELDDQQGRRPGRDAVY